MATKKGIKPMTTFKIDDSRTITTYITTAQECSHMIAHPTVQRGLDPTYARKLKRELLSNVALGFAPIGCLLTVLADGAELVFDGQHRLYAIKEVINELETAQNKHKEAVEYHERMQRERNEALHSTQEGEIDLAKFYSVDPGEYKPDQELVAFTKSPVTIVRYEGVWTDEQLRELFAAFNSGKRVNTNLITAFAFENGGLIQELTERGWIGRFIEDKGGKNSTLYGVSDVVRVVSKIGEVTTLTYLDKLFQEYDKYDQVQRDILQPIGLYAGVSKSLGTSVRMLNAVSKAIMAVQEPTQVIQAIDICVNAATRLMASPQDCNQLLPGVYVPSKTGFATTSATVVEGLIYPWLIWQLHQAGVVVTLPRTYQKQLDKLDTSFETIEGTNIADVIEVFSTLFPKPKTTKPTSHLYKGMSLPNKEAEQYDAQLDLDLDPNNVDL